MSEKLIAAVIAGLVSLIIAGFGILSTHRQNKLAQKRLKKEFQNKFTEKLYEKRMELYPAAFRTAGRIRKLKMPQGITPLEYQKIACDELSIWGEGEAGLFMSDELFNAYWEFRKALANNPGNSEFYSDKQVEKLWRARQRFRQSLRADLGNLYTGENESNEQG